MTKRYFDVHDDLYLSGRWSLGKVVDECGETVIPGLLLSGQPASFSGALKVQVRAAGKPLDFTFAAFDVPVVNARVATLLRELAPQDLELIPVAIDAQVLTRTLVEGAKPEFEPAA